MSHMQDTSEKQDGTIGKALDVLDLVASFERPVRLNTIQARSPYPKGTLYRLLQTLSRQQVLSYDAETQRYALGSRLMRLAHLAWRDFSLAKIAVPYIRALAEQVNKTIHLAQLDSAQVLYLDKVSSDDAVPMYSQAGKIGPAYCTGVGKVMLAFLEPSYQAEMLQRQSWYRFTNNTIIDIKTMQTELEQIRQQVYAMDLEEHEMGICCLALPVLSEQGKLLGAISVTEAMDKADIDQLLTLRKYLQQCANQIAKEASYWTFPHITKE